MHRVPRVAAAFLTTVGVLGASLFIGSSALASPARTGAPLPPAERIGGVRATPSDGAPYLVTAGDQASLDHLVTLLTTAGRAPDEVWNQALFGVAVHLDSPTLAVVRRTPGVTAIELDRAVHADGIETSPPWGLDRIDQRARPGDGLYHYSATGAGVKAYVLDSGIWPTHTEFTGRLATGAYYDFNQPSGAGTLDCNDHGTHVSGIIGGTTYGVAKQVTIVPVKVLDCQGNGTGASIMAGIDWIVNDHVNGTPAVANMSLDGAASAQFDTAVQTMIDDGITVVVAAGNNSGADACNYSPARLPGAITVAASTETDGVASFSNLGSCVDIFAPGNNVLSSVRGPDNVSAAYYSGTSMASPHVAGAAALLLQNAPTATPAQIWAAIDTNATTGVIATAPGQLLYTPSTEHTLTVTKAGPGSGTVTSSPSGISCGATCSAPFPDTTVVTLTAGASGGSEFRGWSGAGCSGTSTCAVTVSASAGVTATFGGAVAITSDNFTATSLALPGQTQVTWTATMTDTQPELPSTLAAQLCPPGAAYPDGPWCTPVTMTSTGTASQRTYSGAFNVDPAAPGGSWIPYVHPFARTITGASRVHVIATPRDTLNPFLAPVRLVDTRPGLQGVLEVVDEATPFSPNEIRRYVPAGVNDVPAGATMALNVVAVTPSGQGYLQVWPCDALGPPPTLTAFMNYPSGVTVANSGLVQLSPNGGICVKSLRQTDLVIDATGWFPAGSTFTALAAPRRLLDTRPVYTGAAESIDETTPLAAGEVRRYVVGATAALAVNVAAVSPAADGTLALYPCDSTASVPVSAVTVAFRAGVTLANGGVVVLSSGAFCIRSSATVHVVVDSPGSFGIGAGFATFSAPSLPVLLIDTRAGVRGVLETSVDNTTPLSALGVRRIVLAGSAGFPSAGTLGSVAINIEALNAGAPGWVNAWACDSIATPPPSTAIINFVAGAATSNGALVGVSANGGICLQSNRAIDVAVSATNWFTT